MYNMPRKVRGIVCHHIDIQLGSQEHPSFNHNHSRLTYWPRHKWCNRRATIRRPNQEMKKKAQASWVSLETKSKAYLPVKIILKSQNHLCKLKTTSQTSKSTTTMIKTGLALNSVPKMTTSLSKIEIKVNIWYNHHIRPMGNIKTMVEFTNLSHSIKVWIWWRPRASKEMQHLQT